MRIIYSNWRQSCEQERKICRDARGEESEREEVRGKTFDLSGDYATRELHEIAENQLGIATKIIQGFILSNRLTNFLTTYCMTCTSITPLRAIKGE